MMVISIAELHWLEPVAVVVSPVLIAVDILNRANDPGAMLKEPPATIPN
jgi:hypothetical protein